MGLHRGQLCQNQTEESPSVLPAQVTNGSLLLVISRLVWLLSNFITCQPTPLLNSLCCKYLKWLLFSTLDSGWYSSLTLSQKHCPFAASNSYLSPIHLHHSAPWEKKNFLHLTQNGVCSQQNVTELRSTLISPDVSTMAKTIQINISVKYLDNFNCLGKPMSLCQSSVLWQGGLCRRQRKGVGPGEGPSDPTETILSCRPSSIFSAFGVGNKEYAGLSTVATDQSPAPKHTNALPVSEGHHLLDLWDLEGYEKPPNLILFSVGGKWNPREEWCTHVDTGIHGRPRTRTQVSKFHSPL